MRRRRRGGRHWRRSIQMTWRNMCLETLRAFALLQPVLLPSPCSTMPGSDLQSGRNRSAITRIGTPPSEVRSHPRCGRAPPLVGG
eukprot:8857946-Pyramimonas_sp.AAC.1